MPVVPINYWAILVCGVVAMIIGSLWYGPLFGKLWMSFYSSKEIEAGKKKGMAKQYGIMFVGSLVMAYVLAHAYVFASTYLHASGWIGGVVAAFWNWLGFVAPVTMGGVLWEGKSWRLWILNNAYNLVTLSVMGVIIAVWQ